MLHMFSVGFFFKLGGNSNNIYIAPFWANLFLYSYEHDYIKRRIKEDRVQAKHFLSTFRFIDDLCSINEGGEFGKVFKDIYPDELELKVEHEGNSASFLNLDIHIQNNQFVYKLYDKGDAFPFSIVRMPYLCSNIPKKIFYSALVGEFLRIARATLYLSDFEPKAIDLVKRMLNQGGDRTSIEKYLLKIILIPSLSSVSDQKISSKNASLLQSHNS